MGFNQWEQLLELKLIVCIGSPILQLPNFFHRCIGLILEVRQFHRLLSRRNRLDR